MFVFANVARVGASAREKEREGDHDDGTVDDIIDDRYSARLFTKPVLLWFEARNRTWTPVPASCLFNNLKSESKKP